MAGYREPWKSLAVSVNRRTNERSAMKYRVELQRTVLESYDIEASSIEDAELVAEELRQQADDYEPDLIDEVDYEVYAVREVTDG
jgi:hypothetical protein